MTESAITYVTNDMHKMKGVWIDERTSPPFQCPIFENGRSQRIGPSNRHVFTGTNHTPRTLAGVAFSRPQISTLLPGPLNESRGPAYRSLENRMAHDLPE